MTAQQRTEHLKVVLPTMVNKPIEIKSVPDAKGQFKKAIEKGRSQPVGPLRKRLQCAFDFGGAGADTCADGVSLTHLLIVAIQLTLLGLERKKLSWG
jgi:hypothetical protein